MKTITIRVENDRDVELLKSILHSTKFEDKIESYEEGDDLSDEQVKVFNERVEEYRRNPSKGKSLEEVNELLKNKYGV